MARSSRPVFVALMAFVWLWVAAVAPAAADRGPKPAAVPDWYALGIAAALLDPTPGVLESAMDLPRAGEALAIIGARYPDPRGKILDRLVKLAAGSDTHVQRSVAAALGAIGSSDPEQRRTILDSLVKLAASNDTDVQQSTATALGAISTSDPEQRRTILDTLVRLDASNDPDVLQSVARALGAIHPGDPRQRRILFDALVKLADDEHWPVQEAVAAALGNYGTSDPDEHEIILDTLVKLAASGIPDPLGARRAINSVDSEISIPMKPSMIQFDFRPVQESVAAALVTITTNYPEQREVVLNTLFGLAASKDALLQTTCAAALGDVIMDYPEQRSAILYTLVKLASSDDIPVQNHVAAALGAIGTLNLDQRGTVVDTLIKLATVANPRRTHSAKPLVAIALGEIGTTDPEQRGTILDTLAKLVASDEEDVATSAVAALGAIGNRNPEQRRAVLDMLAKVIDRGFPEVQESVAAALGKFDLRDPDQRHVVLDTLTKLAGSDDPSVQQSAAAALVAINPSEPEDRGIALDKLVKLASYDRLDVQRSIAATLGTIRSSDPEQRTMVLETLFKLAASNYNVGNDVAIESLISFGPFNADRVVQVLAKLHDDAPRETPRWRGFGWAFVGALPGPEPGPTLMAYAGRPAAIAVPQPKDRTEASRVLGVFATYWPAMAQSPSLQAEIASRAATIVREACPAVAPITNANPFAAILEHVLGEGSRTFQWLDGLISGAGKLRCWQGKDRTTLVQLEKDFAASKDDSIVAYDRELREDLAADGAMPALGPSVLGFAGWVILWAGFLTAFPYSGRIRAAYLFNENLSNAVSLWFVPLLMTLLPPLRRHMLRPFREELLADARLDDLQEEAWYSGVRVRGRGGQVQPVATAIPDIKGKLVLIGESGLGKSTYLRILAKRSRRTTVFLTASSCDKGVEEAIVQRVSGFQSAALFRSLIYSGDLVVLIDGLNEVSAEVRAGIIAFANRAGRARLLMATQPIEGIGTDRSPFTRATAFELLPLARAEIENFLKTRPARATAKDPAEYDATVDRLLEQSLQQAPAEESVLGEQQAAELILSNPMDLTYASELIAAGITPRPSQMIGQAFEKACQRYRSLYDRDFPRLAFARKIVDLIREDRNWLRSDEFPNEQGVLAGFKLMVPRSMKEAADKEIQVLRFRHDKVTDLLMKPAFEADQTLQIDLIDDPRFRGVYLLFAQDEDRQTARRLRDLLVSHAARKRDNGLSNEFVRRFDLVPSESEHVPWPDLSVLHPPAA